MKVWEEKGILLKEFIQEEVKVVIEIKRIVWGWYEVGNLWYVYTRQDEIVLGVSCNFTCWIKL